MNVRGAWIWLAGLGLLAPGIAVSAATSETEQITSSNLQARVATVRSPDRSFMVTDLPSREALSVMVWADTVKQLVSDWAQSPIPGKFVYPIVIAATARADVPQGRVFRSQVYSDDGHFRQKMTMVNPSVIDQEDVLENLVHLLLNRWIHGRSRKAGNREEFADVPEWFSIGVAQNIYPELKDRNYKNIRKNEDDGTYKPASDVFSFTYASPGRWPEKSHAGLVMAWIAEQMPPAELLEATADRMARREAADEDYFITLLGFQGRREMNIAWDLWMARQERRMMPGVLSSETEAINRLLEMRADDFGLVHHGLPPGGRVPAALLVDDRDEAWARELARTVAWRLHQESIGKIPEIRKLIEPFIAFLENIALESKKSSGKKKKQWTTSRRLKKDWKNARQDWLDFLEAEENRRRYIDGFMDQSKRPLEDSREAVRDMLQRWERIESDGAVVAPP